MPFTATGYQPPSRRGDQSLSNFRLSRDGRLQPGALRQSLVHETAVEDLHVRPKSHQSQQKGNHLLSPRSNLATDDGPKMKAGPWGLMLQREVPVSAQLCRETARHRRTRADRTLGRHAPDRYHAEDQSVPSNRIIVSVGGPRREIRPT